MSFRRSVLALGFAVTFPAMLIMSAFSALAERRVALVIGNSAYRNAAPLKNPSNDAQDISAALARLGFEIVSGSDLDSEGMRKTVKAFSDKLVGADVALFYYAGHAVQIDGQNYLAPVDTDLAKRADLDFETVSLDLVRRQMEREAQTQLIFLDACRNNPLGRNLGPAGRSQTDGTGLARLETSAEGTFIAFATQPDNIALDGEGRNSPFTTAMLKHIDRPGLELSELMTQVRREVYEATDKQQLPWTNSSLLGSFFFKAAEPEPEPTPEEKARADKLARLAADAEAWEAVKDSKDIAVFEAFLKQHADSTYGDLARFNIDRLRPPPAPAKPVVEEKLAVATATTVEGTAEKPVDVPQVATEKSPANAVEKPIITAALPVQPEPETVVSPPVADKETTRAIQSELDRLKCSPGKPDGVWGGKSRDALKDYATNAKVDLASLEPSAQLLDELKKVQDPVCPEVQKTPVEAAPKATPSAKPTIRKVVAPEPKRKVATVRKKVQSGNCFRFNGQLICD